jgi:hypothetical protein
MLTVHQTTELPENVLSAECEKLLTDCELFSREAYTHGKADLFDANDGVYFARVTIGIALDDLSAMISLQKRAYKRGEEAGKGAMQAALRALLGAAAQSDVEQL